MEKYRIMSQIERMKFKAQLMLEYLETIEDLPEYAEQLQLLGVADIHEVSAVVNDDAIEWADPSSLQ